MFGLVSFIAIIAILTMALNDVWPARKPVMLIWGIFTLYIFDIAGAIRWIILGAIKLVNNL